MGTEQITECQVAEGAVLVMAMTMTTARVRRTHGAVRKGPGNRREQKMGRRNGQRKGKWKGKAMENRKAKAKGNGKGIGIVKQTQGGMISFMPLLCS
jgi:hypothetical protein